MEKLATKKPKKQHSHAVKQHICNPKAQQPTGYTDCGGQHSCGQFCNKIFPHSGKHYCASCRTEF
jgi:hypothetical protein